MSAYLAQGSRADIPELPPGCGSWIVTSPTGRVVELFTAVNVHKAAAAGWKVETALAYLQRINLDIRNKTCT